MINAQQAFEYLDANYFDNRVMEEFGESIRDAETDDDYSPDDLARAVVHTIKSNLNGLCPGDRDTVLHAMDDLFSAITGWGLDTLTDRVMQEIKLEKEEQHVS